MPLSAARRWSDMYAVNMPKYVLVDLEEKRRQAGSIGGKARVQLYGGPGTVEGRRKGGLASIAVHARMSESPFVARSVPEPARDINLAELIGAILGDGHMGKYQFVLCSNILDEREYADYLVSLISKVFGISPSIVLDPMHGVMRIICSSKRASDHLQALGLHTGNKTKLQASVPSWILDDSRLARACLRGLVDTDGCVYKDRHQVKGKNYVSTCIAFTNASIPLLDFVEEQWKFLGFSPTRSARDVRIRRRPDVRKYSKEVGFSNTKHSAKIAVE